MGRIEPLGCSCSSAAPRLSVLASQCGQNGRDLSITASQSGKTRIGGSASSMKMAQTTASVVGVKSNLAGFFTREKSGICAGRYLVQTCGRTKIKWAAELFDVRSHRHANQDDDFVIIRVDIILRENVAQNVDSRGFDPYFTRREFQFVEV